MFYSKHDLEPVLNLFALSPSTVKNYMLFLLLSTSDKLGCILWIQKDTGKSVGAGRKVPQKPVPQKKSSCSKAAEDVQKIGVKSTLNNTPAKHKN